MSSLHRQLALSLALGTVGLCVLLYLLVASAVRDLAEAQVASRLEHDAEGLLAGLAFAADGTPTLLPGTAGTLYRQPFGGHYYRIDAAGTTLVSRSSWDQTLAVTEARIAHASGPREQPLLVFRGDYRRDGRAVVIRVAEELTALEASIALFQWRYALLNGLLLVALLALQALALRRGLRPLSAVRDDLERLERGATDELPERGPSEIAPLLSAFNATHAAMRHRLERSRKALGNLAHALKTPLAVLNQIDADPALAAHRPLRDALRRQTEAIGGSIDRELRRARIAGFAPAGTCVALDATVTDLVAVLANVHRDRAPRVEVTIPAGTALRVDPHDLHELLGNLLDNACKWATGCVRVSAQRGDGLTLTVEDDGPGVPESRRAELTARGTRLDEAALGHGLGLAIAADIAAQYGMRLGFATSALGGLAVTITLPETLLAP